MFLRRAGKKPGAAEERSRRVYMEGEMKRKALDEEREIRICPLGKRGKRSRGANIEEEEGETRVLEEEHERSKKATGEEEESKRKRALRAEEERTKS